MYKKILLSSFSVFILTIVLFTAGCSNSPKQNAGQDYLNEIKEWDNNRINNLKSKTGWLNLAGLFWLKEGENKIGSSKKNDIVFPEGKADDYIGSFYLRDGQVKFSANPEVEVYSDGELVKEITVRPDTAENTTIMNHRNLSWFIIIRDDKIGIRLRDFESDLVNSLHKIDRFPIDTSWIINAKYVVFDTPRKFVVPNILGTFSEEEANGEIVFSKDGKDFSITPIAAGDKYFIIFADETSGIETYGAGRFLYANVEDSNGKIVLDFNKAYNPPCAFTKYATCPLPPKENHLKLPVTAGEKNWGNH